MSKEEQDHRPSKTPASAEASEDPKRAVPGTEVEAREEPSIEARICAYYENPNIKPPSFLKAVRAAKIKRFEASDIADASERLKDADLTLERTAALLGKGPDVIERWVEEVTKEALKRWLGERVLDEEPSARGLFDRVVRECREALGTKDRQQRARAGNLLRLSLVWLFEKRNLTPVDALLSMRALKKETRNVSATKVHVDAVRLMKRSKPTQLSALLTISALYERAIAEASEERISLRAALTSAREHVQRLEDDLRISHGELKKSEDDQTHLSDELAIRTQEVENEKELRALDRSKQKGRHRSFLKNRVIQPLSDARDALDFDPPHVEAARQRVEMALAAICEEMGKRSE